ncbi:MAG: RluA family pseudouridine synthase [Oscillospiraceae bacterium]|nr:RluA family pseudouridine synthase [Oscillospiraceae bacterium]
MELHHKTCRDGRLSDILKNEMQVSTGLMNRLKTTERILVNGAPQRTNFAVKGGDTVTLLLDEPEPEYPGEDAPLTILYEDDHILAVDKPAGVLIHPSRSRDTGTLANAVVGYYARTGQKSAFHPLTRLDRDTFGVVLIAKNSHIHALLQQTPLQKIYHARVFGCLPEAEGIIDAPIDRRPLPSLLRYISPTGKPSQTRYRVLERFSGHSLVELEPLTGRTHQLRLHCAHLGCPILGDPQYGSVGSMAYSEQFGYAYQRLCAKRVEFVHPLTREHITIESGMCP